MSSIFMLFRFRKLFLRLCKYLCNCGVIIRRKILNLNCNLWLRLLKNGDFVLIRHILRLKFSYVLLQFQIYRLQFSNVILDFRIGLFKLRRDTLWAFHRRFPSGIRVLCWKIRVIP